MSSFSVSGKTDFSRQKTIREEKEEEKREQQRRRRGGDEKTQVGSIQVSTGQPQWSGPEKGSDGRCKSCRSQAHHGCSPDPLHVWLPIAAILLLPPLPLCLYMVVSPITAMEKERKRERGGGWIQETNSRRTEGEGGAGRGTEREHRDERCVLRAGVNAAVDGARLKDSLFWLLQ